MKTPFQPAKDGITLNLYVQPGASASGWCGLMGDALKLRIAASPHEGQANKAVCLFLSEYFGVPKSSVTITKGHTGRRKTVSIQGLPAALLAAATALLN